ncbi:MAG TPA: hypothetical protein VG387_01080 [Rhizomicrobium sp.]|jgi:hypothetical protein|nr:hypothetical protein [Rhizomicrobium sp.]
MQTSKLDTIERVLKIVGIPSIAIGVGLPWSFYWLGSLTPDLATGRTYPVQMHGTMYVTPLLGEIHDVCFFVGFAAMAGVVAPLFWRQYRAGSQD